MSGLAMWPWRRQGLESKPTTDQTNFLSWFLHWERGPSDLSFDFLEGPIGFVLDIYVVEIFTLT